MLTGNRFLTSISKNRKVVASIAATLIITSLSTWPSHHNLIFSLNFAEAGILQAQPLEGPPSANVVRASGQKIGDGCKGWSGVRSALILSHKSYVTGLAWNLDGSLIATGSELNRHITIWNSADGHVIREFSRGLNIGSSIAFTKDGYLATSVGSTNPDDAQTTITLWNAISGEIVGRVRGPYPDKPEVYNAARTFVLSPRGSYVAVIAYAVPGQPVALYKTTDWNQTETVVVPNDTPISAAFSPDERYVAVGTIRGLISEFDVSTGKSRWAADAYGRFVTGVESLSYSADGRYLASGSTIPTAAERLPGGGVGQIEPPNSIRVWDAATGNPAYSYNGNFRAARGLAWNPNANCLATGTDDGRVRLWASNGTEPPLVIGEFANPVVALAFSPDGERLAVGAGKEIRIFNIRKQ